VGSVFGKRLNEQIGFESRFDKERETEREREREREREKERVCVSLVKIVRNSEFQRDRRR